MTPVVNISDSETPPHCHPAIKTTYSGLNVRDPHAWGRVSQRACSNSGAFGTFHVIKGQNARDQTTRDRTEGPNER